MKRAEKWSISLAVIALIVSIATLILTSPLILDNIRRPVLKTIGSYPMIYENRVVTWFRLENTGQSSARGIVLKVWCFEKDAITFPQSSLTTIRQKATARFPVGPVGIVEERVYECDELLPNQMIFLVIASDKIKYEQMKNSGQLIDPQIRRFTPIPNIVNVVSPGAKSIRASIRVEPEQLISVPNMEKPVRIDRGQ